MYPLDSVRCIRVPGTRALHDATIDLAAMSARIPQMVTHTHFDFQTLTAASALRLCRAH